MKEKTSVLLVTTQGKGNGIGHLKRSMRLLRDDKIEISFHDRLTNDTASFDLVVIDIRETTLELLSKYEKYGPVVGLDEGGDARRFFPFLIDSLQIQTGMNKPNIFSDPLESIGYEDTENKIDIERCREIKSNKFRIMISFGGEDPMNLSSILVETLARYKLLDLHDFTVVIGPFFKEQNRKNIMRFPVHLIEGVEELLPCMKDFDLIITSYGNTPYEAIASGIPVILFNPTGYHEWLGRRIGFFDMGVRKPNIKKLKRLIRKLRDAKNRIYRIETARIRSGIAKGKKYSESLEKPLKAKYFRNLKYIGNMNCPVCKRLNTSIARFNDRTFFRCKDCGIIYQVYLGERKTEYDKDYFFRDYKRQYGKTYLEDFDNLKKTGKTRLEVIEEVIGNYTSHNYTSNKRILDVGCALGAFLSVAREKGYKVTGLDISSEAVDYVNSRLGIKAYNIDFADFEGSNFDIITMWFVIEHFVNLDVILKKVNKHLSLGGVFAFSTPNGNGISARKNMLNFLKNNPIDHFTILTPPTAKKVLEKYGFTISRIRITGHHYERFPLSHLLPTNIVKKLLDATSRLFGLGDTFEVYAVKKREV